MYLKRKIKSFLYLDVLSFCFVSVLIFCGKGVRVLFTGYILLLPATVLQMGKERRCQQRRKALPPKKKAKERRAVNSPLLLLVFRGKGGREGRCQFRTSTPHSSLHFSRKKKNPPTRHFLISHSPRKDETFLWGGGGKREMNWISKTFFALDINESPEGVFWGEKCWRIEIDEKKGGRGCCFWVMALGGEGGGGGP